MMYRKRSKQGGFTILELITVISIIAILAVGGFQYFRSSKETARTSKTVEVVRQIGTGAISWGQSRSTYSGISLSTLQSGGYVASNLSANPFGGAYTISGSGTTFTVTATTMTDNACAQAIDLLSSDTTATPTCTSGTLSATFGS